MFSPGAKSVAKCVLESQLAPVGFLLSSSDSQDFQAAINPLKAIENTLPSLTRGQGSPNLSWLFLEGESIKG